MKITITLQFEGRTEAFELAEEDLPQVYLFLKGQQDAGWLRFRLQKALQKVTSQYVSSRMRSRKTMKILKMRETFFRLKPQRQVGAIKPKKYDKQ